MRIRDWSSDVCSSDLRYARQAGARQLFGSLRRDIDRAYPNAGTAVGGAAGALRAAAGRPEARAADRHRSAARVPCGRDRKSAVEGKDVSLLVDICGCRFSKRKKKSKDIKQTNR